MLLLFLSYIVSLNEKKKKEENKISYPTGVLVNIAQCYSPTCFEDSPCYSYSCPKRRIYEKVVNKKVSLEHIKTTINNTLPLQNTWSTSIGKPYIKKMEKKEIKRQEIIYEFIQTEKEYVEDLFSVKTVNIIIIIIYIYMSFFFFFFFFFFFKKIYIYFLFEY